jgi:hypothetical protein
MKFTSLMLITAVLLTLSFDSEAARKDNRQELQRGRIQEGVKNESLTKRESRRLRLEQRHIRRVEKRMAADGQITPEEKARLEKLQDRASKDIYKQKHDSQNQKSDTAAQVEAPVEAKE